MVSVNLNKRSEDMMLMMRNWKKDKENLGGIYMFLIPSVLIIVGIVFFVINLFFIVRTYTRMVQEKTIRWNHLWLNVLGNISSFVLFLLGIVYLIIINQQL